MHMLNHRVVNLLLCSLYLILEIMAVFNKDNLKVNYYYNKVNGQLSVKPYRYLIEVCI